MHYGLDSGATNEGLRIPLDSTYSQLAHHSGTYGSGAVRPQID